MYITNCSKDIYLLNNSLRKWTYLKTVTGGTETSFDSGYSEYLFKCGTPFYHSSYVVPAGWHFSDIVFSHGTLQQFLGDLNCYSYKVQIKQAYQDGVDNLSNAKIDIYAR